MPIKNCIHHQEDKLTSLQFHLHSRNSIVRFAAPKREILYVTCNETMEREIEPLSTVYNSFLTPSLQFQSIEKNIFEMMNVRANFKGYRVETTRKAKRFDSIIDQTDERKRATNIEPPFVDRSSRYPGGRGGEGGGEGIILKKMPRFLTIESRVLQYLRIGLCRGHRPPRCNVIHSALARLSIRAQAP